MVSVIVPIYNVELYLRDCIESILKQTYKNLQVILVDDGSPDNCGIICDEYAQKDCRVLSLHKENGGVSSARNFGLQYATGEYVTFCDSDDMYTPDWIEALMNAALIHQADIVVGNYIRCYGDGYSGNASNHQVGKIELMDARVDYIFNKLMTPEHGWEVCTRLFRTNIIQEEKIRFCETCGNFAEDLSFSLTYTLLANSVISIAETGYLYRIHSDSMMQTSAYNPKLESLQEVCEFCRPTIDRIFPTEIAVQFFDDLNFFLLGSQFSSAMWASGIAPNTFRRFVISNVTNWPSIKNQIKGFLKKKKFLSQSIPKSRKQEVLAHLYFLLGMPWLLLRIQCKLIRTFRSILDRE